MTQSPQPGKVRIYVDVSETLGLDVRTGIQRVVREVAREPFAADGRYEIVPVVAVAGRFYRLSARGEQQLTAPSPTTYRPGKPARPTVRGRAAKLVLAPFPGLIKRLQAWRDARGMDRLLTTFRKGRPVQPRPGDRVVLADTYSLSSALAAGMAARKEGAALIALTYDLIPISHPELHDIGMVNHFRNSVPRGMDSSDGVLTISDWCVDEIKRFGVNKPIGRFYLGYNIPTDKTDTMPMQAGWPDALWVPDTPVFLMVGTIASSKGHGIAISAFEQLWRDGSDARLLLIGRPGWEEALMGRIAGHPEAGKRLFVVHGATDTMLNDAFHRATAVIQGSAVEGFGLPVVEAMARHVPLIASNIPVFREIAGDAALYYPQPDSGALAQAVRTMVQERETWAARARDFAWISWTEARDQFALEADRVARAAGK